MSHLEGRPPAFATRVEAAAVTALYSLLVEWPDYLTPPIGMNRFLSAYRFNRPIVEIIRSDSGIFRWRLAAVLGLTYLPWPSTWLPSHHQ